MKLFTDAEMTYLTAMDLGRIATTGTAMQPHVTPVTYYFDLEREAIVVPGFDVQSRKYRDLSANRKTGFVVDDVVSLDPFEARGVVIHGDAEIHESGGEHHSEEIGGSWLLIQPRRVVSWGLELASHDSGEEYEYESA